MGKNKISVKGDKELIKRIQKLKDTSKVREVLIQSGEEVKREAIVRAPVDTGFLRRNILKRTNKAGKTLESVITSHAEYSGFLEYGTRYMRAQPYMRPAVEQVKPKFQEQLRRAVKDSR